MKDTIRTIKQIDTSQDLQEQLSDCEQKVHIDYTKDLNSR